MRNKNFRPLITLAFLLCFGSQSSAQTLTDIYQLALNNDPLLQEAAANRLAILESKPQAKSGLLPQINLSGSYQDNATDGSGSEFDNTINRTVSADFENDTDALSYQLVLQQPVFRWDRWIALKRADKSVAQAEANYAAAEQDLAVRVTRAYFAVLTARDSLQAETINKEAIKRQLEQNESRFEVGLIAITDVLESRAAFDQTVASEIEAKRILATARENLREITGSRVTSLAAPGEEFELINPNPIDEDAWVELALRQNMLLEANRIAVQIANDDIKTQRTGHYPTLDLVLNRSTVNSDGSSINVVTIEGNPPNLPVPGFSDQDTTTDSISLQFNVPIYSGGAVSSRVRQAVYQKQAAQQRLERTARETERQTRDAYLSVLSEISRVKALQESVKSSEAALEATEAGFDVGTRTSVDVLNSRRDLLRSQVNYYRARYDYLVNMILLKQAAGSLSGEDLNQINRWLNSVPSE